MADTRTPNGMADLRPDMRILVPAAIVLLVIIGSSVLFPERSQAILSSMYGAFVNATGTWYLWVTFAMICLSAFFAMSKYGDIKFGAPDEKPEFNTYSWLAMMFCSGVAGAVMFWSIVEPLWDLISLPQYAEPMSREAFEWSLAYVMLHWGPVTWPWYVIVALPICYMFHTQKKPVLRISSAAEPFLGKSRVDGWLGKFIEVFFIIGLMFSNAAVMGVSLPIVNHALASTFGFEPSFGMELVILGVSAVIFTTSVCAGLKKGIKILSDVNVLIALSMVAFTFIVGPTTFIVDNFTNAFGKMTGNFFEMLFWTAPFEANSFPKDWTVFYALWMASYGPFMGLFIARISRGRTVREVIMMGIFGGIAGSFLIHGVFGGFTLHQQWTGAVDAVGVLKASGGPAALVAVLNSLPGSVIVLIGYCVFSTIFLATSVDSCAYVISCAATTKLVPGTEPTRGHRFFWAAMQAGLALAAITLGGLGPVKIFANFAGALMLIPITFVVISWFKMIKGYKAPAERREERVESVAQTVTAQAGAGE
ncbi:BCCT family betaine/carnitine transporter [Desulfobaculum xiamenense]|uniref:BCCT family betaine/carnitine transporter n=1 Tax=Desulfobaculum xiamenense TaxID=995050 RepID=A0A846QDN4_9BACT|nr:BCCT family transporter [Desulfobaculum xiamenense]NJB66488.1 BCCT family betaine/carnitine transporter [Desulfobaculum xiamenense]